jgi:hypothetical protein
MHTGLEIRIVGIDVAETVHGEGVVVYLRLDGTNGDTPNAPIVFLHRLWPLCEFATDGYFIGFGSGNAKGDRAVGMNLGGD